MPFGLLRIGRRCAVAAVASVTLLASPTPGNAHPHVLIDARATVQLDEDRRIEAIRIEWTFDEFFSAYALEELEVENGDAATAEQRAAMAEQYVTSLAEWNYMTELAVDADYAELGAPTDYSVSIDDNIVTLFLTLPLVSPVDPKAHEVALRMYDPTYYIAIEYAGDDALQIAGNSTEGCTTTIDDSEPTMEMVPLGESGFAASDRATQIGFLYAQTGWIRCE